MTHSRDQLEVDHGFVAGTGIECSAPIIEGGIRMDELAKTGHYEHVDTDIRMVRELGVRYLRYGIPIHLANPAPGTYDWTFTDRAMAAMQREGVEPIVDLLHFGLPDDVPGFGDETFPERFAAFVAAFVERFPWARYYTPVNEPLITAAFSAKVGYWNERRSDDRSFVRAMLNVARCAVRGTQEIRARRPDAVFLQSDSCEAYHPVHPDAIERAAFLNELRFIGFELVYGRRLPDVVRDYVLANGGSEEELAWFEEHGSDAGCIAGNDYYAVSEKEVLADGTLVDCGVRAGYYRVGREYHERLGVPIMLAETNMEGDGAVAWLHRVWTDAIRLRDDGVPIRGFVWYGFVNHVDWDSTLTRNDGRENTCGLVSLQRVPNATYAAYRQLIEGLDERSAG
jgi:beta-glucosidase/6-phospho-beta-glucosidase/beta-galactosidase